jgi:hypothetical protein
MPLNEVRNLLTEKGEFEMDDDGDEDEDEKE